MPATLQFAFLIAILLPASKIVSSLCSRFCNPAIIGELMVGVVLLTTLITPLLMRGTFAIPCPQDIPDDDDEDNGGGAEEFAAPLNGHAEA